MANYSFKNFFLRLLFSQSTSVTDDDRKTTADERQPCHKLDRYSRTVG